MKQPELFLSSDDQHSGAVEKESNNDKDTSKSAPSKLQQLTLTRGGDCEDK